MTSHPGPLCDGTASAEVIANITAELTAIPERPPAGPVIDASVMTDDEFAPWCRHEPTRDGGAWFRLADATEIVVDDCYAATESAI